MDKVSHKIDEIISHYIKGIDGLIGNLIDERKEFEEHSHNALDEVGVLKTKLYLGI